jgi:hypothetical protein
MNFPQEVSINERDIARLTKLYQTAYAQIEKEIEGATEFGVRNRKQILYQIDGILKELDSDTAPILEEALEKQYTTGAGEAVEQLKFSGAQDIPVTAGFNRIHKDAIAVLVSETQEAFAQSIQGIHKSANRLIGAGVRQQLTEQMAIGKIQGAALRTIKNNVIGVLKTDGLSALVDKGGRTWKLDRYAEMLIRTKSVEARNVGMLNRMVENGYDLVQVSSHGASDNCGDWEGKILSVRGDTPGYPTVEMARSGGLFHPNCKHAINTLIPALAKVTNAYNPNVDTVTGKDFVDEVDAKFKGAYKSPAQVIGTKTPAR